MIGAPTRGVAGPAGWTTFTPELRDQGGTLSYTAASAPDFDTTYYGDPTFGRWRTNGGKVEEKARLIVGSAFGSFNAGSGWYYVPLRATPSSWITGPIGHGQVVIGTHFATVKFEIDPVLDMAAGLAAPGARANVAWIFLEGDHDPNSTAMVVSASNPAVPSTRMIVAWDMEYPVG